MKNEQMTRTLKIDDPVLPSLLQDRGAAAMTHAPLTLCGLDATLMTFVHAHPNCRASDVVAYIMGCYSGYTEFDIRYRLARAIESGFVRYVRDWRLKADWRPAPWMEQA